MSTKVARLYRTQAQQSKYLNYRSAVVALQTIHRCVKAYQTLYRMKQEAANSSEVGADFENEDFGDNYDNGIDDDLEAAPAVAEASQLIEEKRNKLLQNKKATNERKEQAKEAANSANSANKEKKEKEADRAEKEWKAARKLLKRFGDGKKWWGKR